MTEHLSARNLELFAAGSLPPAEFLSADDHLVECESCRSLLAGMKNPGAKIERLHLQFQDTGMSHLEYEDLEAYLDHRSDETDREIIESHLEHCSLCAQLVRDLEDQAPAQQSSVQKLIFLWKSPEYAAPFRFVAIAAVVACFALILAMVFRLPDQDIRAQLREESEKNLRVQQELREAKQKIAQLENRTSEEPLIATLHDNGGVVGLVKDGTLRGAENYPDRYRQIAKAALQQQRVPYPGWIKELQGETAVLMGQNSPGSFNVTSPVGRVVESARPLFAWQPLNGATQYRVEVFDTKFRPVASSGALHDASWIPDKPLPRGLNYMWKVTAVVNGKELIAPLPPAPEARFKVLEQEKAAELADLRKSGSHLLLGLAYADSGLVSEARSEFEILVRQNADSQLSKDLFQSLP